MATQKPVLCYNLLGQKPVNPLLTPHALFQLNGASHPSIQYTYTSHTHLTQCCQMAGIPAKSVKRGQKKM